LVNLTHISTIEKAIAEQHAPGLALAIQQGDTILYEGYFGSANLEHDVPVTRNTVFEIASVTKLFTAQAVLRLAQEGKIRLDQPLTAHLDNLPETWSPITIQHILMHQSGIPDYTSAERYWELHRRAKSHDEVLELVRDLPVLFAPGERYNYDNTGFYLLGLLIEKVAQMPYIDYLRRTIFEPQGMSRTQGNDYERIIPDRAQGYLYRDGAFHNKIFYDTSNTFSAGILVSNAADLLAWRASLYDDSILNAEYRHLWWTPHPSQAANEREFKFTMGLGWFIVDRPAGTFYGHGGGIPGFRSSFMHFRDADVTAVVLYNGEHIDAPENLALDVIQEMGILN
jgi:CubicO group peptidase (beta-lactamase class C family)